MKFRTLNLSVKVAQLFVSHTTVNGPKVASAESTCFNHFFGCQVWLKVASIVESELSVGLASGFFFPKSA